MYPLGAVMSRCEGPIRAVSNKIKLKWARLIPLAVYFYTEPQHTLLGAFFFELTTNKLTLRGGYGGLNKSKPAHPHGWFVSRTNKPIAPLWACVGGSRQDNQTHPSVWVVARNQTDNNLLNPFHHTNLY